MNFATLSVIWAASKRPRLSDTEAAIVKAMITRGDRQHDIAAFFNVNGGRVADVSTGTTHDNVAPALPATLPPKGTVRPLVSPYMNWLLAGCPT